MQRGGSLLMSTCDAAPRPEKRTGLGHRVAECGAQGAPWSIEQHFVAKCFLSGSQENTNATPCVGACGQWREEYADCRVEEQNDDYPEKNDHPSRCHGPPRPGIRTQAARDVWQE